MHLAPRLAAGALLASAGAAQAQSPYTLQAAYDSSNFFQSFDFFTEPDPTKGFVDYVGQAAAQQAGLVAADRPNGTVYMGVDYTTVKPPKGRMSVRVTSKQAFTKGLFVADIAHMPGSICGVWPAYWMFGPNWPTSGEIDIIEGVNTQTQAAITLHTASGCAMSNAGSQASTLLSSPDCGAASSTGGCQQRTAAGQQNYGDGFNDIQGGVYATEWTSDHIAVWFFPRGRIPGDVSSGAPSPAAWGPPLARFAGGAGCEIDAHFAKHKIVFDTTFCGDWAGNADVWGADAECSAKAATCREHVASNPGDFRDAFWEINSVKVYQQAAGLGGEAVPAAGRGGEAPATAPGSEAVPAATPADAPGTSPGTFGPDGSYVAQHWRG